MVDTERLTDAEHELDAPPWRRFESTLMATSKSIRRAYDLLFAEIGLNLSEACLLEYVVEHGPMSQTQVAERIGMGRAPAGTIVDNLSNRSLLRRTPDATDRRVWLLTATFGRKCAGASAKSSASSWPTSCCAFRPISRASSPHSQRNASRTGTSDQVLRAEVHCAHNP
jgi:MarR family transcriptional regulator for hemolysin